ncbi:MAG: MFS transporter [Armatimonadetes bacterium]|nr:MFS transporter [Armatimonadota bacterium]
MKVRAQLDLWLPGLCASRFFMNLIHMTYAACLPVLRGAWGMSAAQAGSVATGFQIGYAVSLLGFSWLADRVGARRIFLTSGALSTIAALGFALFARSYASGLVLFTLVALAQGGTYTTAIMLISDRYRSQHRGAALGWLIAASSLSHAASLLVTGAVLSRGGYQLAFLVTAAGTLAGMLIGWIMLRGTANVIHPSEGGAGAGAELLRNPHAARLIISYTGHSWELLGMWAWAPAFVAASFAASGAMTLRAAELGAYLSASFHLMGWVASSSMGLLSDRLGRRTVILVLAAVSAACSFSFGWLVGGPLLLVAVVGSVYGFTALGDSPVLSVALTEAVRPAYLGSALAIRSLLGFGAGAVAPVVFGLVLDTTNPTGSPASGWGWAFVVLGVGGLAAVLSAWGLPRARRRSFREV